MIRFRKSTLRDRGALMELIEKGFAAEGNRVEISEGTEHRTLFSYLYSQTTWNPEWVWIAEEEGQILAAAGYFPQALTFEKQTLPVGAISPVVTLPTYRSQGLARKCLSQMMSDLVRQGVSLVFLWGLPFYYPRLGFVPVLPRYKTKITVSHLMQNSPETNGSFRECQFEDLSEIAELYQQNQDHYFLQPVRTLKWWQERYREIGTDNVFIKEVPFPKKENFLVWENTSGKITGYLNYSSEYLNYFLQSDDHKVVMSESAAKDINSAEDMIKAFLNCLQTYQTLYIRGTPNHIMNTAAYLLGGTHIIPAPLAGMVKVLDWATLLKNLTPLFCRRLAYLPHAVYGEIEWNIDDLLIQLIIKDHSVKTLVNKGQNDLKIDQNRFFTRLLFGLYHSSELDTFQEEQAELLSILFPQKYPFIWDANYLY
ncbi:MAG TPA: hypothetical protein DDW50_10575 [Firmicutes bacterium]|jgi:predicted N-acetyltransferase YhbS|nr:hypothetical protein [Bacillota bacterium]